MSLLCPLHDSDFTASEMCCAYEAEQENCENTDNGVKNSHTLCRFSHFTQSWIRTCKSDWDTPTFTASMCCACGGGQTILPSTSSETCEHALELTSTPRETRVRTISSISDKDVTEPTTTPTLPLLKCVVDVVV